jgi:plastocyanin
MRSAVLLLLLIALPYPVQAGSIAGKVVLRGLRDNRNAVVYIEKIPGKTFPAPREPIVLDQLNITFVPHVLPVLAGTRVAFPNSDDIRHNVFSPDDKRMNLGTYPSGTTKHYVFNTPGEVTLLCNVHAEMSAYVIVTETPYFAVTDAAGNYSIGEIPAGRYTVTVWNERLKSQTQHNVDVPETGTVSVHFELSRR